MPGGWSEHATGNLSGWGRILSVGFLAVPKNDVLKGKSEEDI